MAFQPAPATNRKSMYSLGIEDVPNVLSASQQSFLDEVVATRNGLMMLAAGQALSHGLQNNKFHLRDFCKVPWRWVYVCVLGMGLGACVCVFSCSLCVCVYT